MGSFKLKLIAWFALLALLPLTVAFYGYDSLARRSETRRADAALEAALRGSVAGYAARLDQAAARARGLAEDTRVQQALQKQDRAALARLLPARPAGPAASRSVTVIAGGRQLGEVTVYVPIDARLLAAIGTGLAPGERLVAARAGRIIAGTGAGGTLTLEPGRASRVEVASVAYRALATAALHDPPGLVLAALAPQRSIDAATSAAERRLFAALLASLVLFAIATYLLGRSVVGSLRRFATAANGLAHGRLHERVSVRGRDEFAQLGGAFNRMASQLEQRLVELETERRRFRDANSRLGEALVATHDPAHLLRVVVESAVEATGAAGGVVLGLDGDELARTGDPETGAERLVFPLRVGSSDFGSLVLTADSFEPQQVETATSLAAQVVVALENARLHRLVERQALVDSLTGLANRRSLEETLRTELARAARFGDPLCVVLSDLDDFKRVNDRHGHAAGDEVLKAFAVALRETVRETDVAGRWGGEEFALVLTGTDEEGGARFAERARAAIAATPLRMPGGEELSVTASFGVAAFPEVHELGELLAAADAALYAAKEAGKNRVVTSSSAV